MLIAGRMHVNRHSTDVDLDSNQCEKPRGSMRVAIRMDTSALTFTSNTDQPRASRAMDAYEDLVAPAKRRTRLDERLFACRKIERQHANKN